MLKPNCGHVFTVDRLLAYSPEQHPIVLQIGRSNIESLAKATEPANAYCYDEINLKKKWQQQQNRSLRKRINLPMLWNAVVQSQHSIAWFCCFLFAVTSVFIRVDGFWFFLLHDSSGGSMLTTTIAWDNDLCWSWENPIMALQETLCKDSGGRFC